MEKELRYFDARFEVRNEENKPKTISGYALTFDQESKDLGGFREVIRRGALDGVLEKSDIIMTLDHNINRGILARHRNSEKDSLKLTIDEVGLRFEFIPGDYDLAKEVAVGIERGDITQCSFAFRCNPEGYHYEDYASSDGIDLRVITQFDQLYDCSVVYNPAYDSTSCDIRSYQEFVEQRNVKENEKKEEEERAMKDYFTSLRAKYND